MEREKQVIAEMFEKFQWSYSIEGDRVTFRSPKWKNHYTGTIRLMSNNGWANYEDCITADTDRLFFACPETKWVAWGDTAGFRALTKTNDPVINVFNGKPEFVTIRKVR